MNRFFMILQTVFSTEYFWTQFALKIFKQWNVISKNLHDVIQNFLNIQEFEVQELHFVHEMKHRVSTLDELLG